MKARGVIFEISAEWESADDVAKTVAHDLRELDVKRAQAIEEAKRVARERQAAAEKAAADARAALEAAARQQQAQREKEAADRARVQAASQRRDNNDDEDEDSDRDADRLAQDLAEDARRAHEDSLRAQDAEIEADRGAMEESDGESDGRGTTGTVFGLDGERVGVRRFAPTAKVSFVLLALGLELPLMVSLRSAKRVPARRFCAVVLRDWRASAARRRK